MVIFCFRFVNDNLNAELLAMGISVEYYLPKSESEQIKQTDKNSGAFYLLLNTIQKFIF